MKESVNIVVIENDEEMASNIRVTLEVVEGCKVCVLAPKGSIEEFCSEIQKALGEKGLILLDDQFWGKVKWSGEHVARHFPDVEIVSINHGECDYTINNWPEKRFLVDSQVARQELISVVQHTRTWRS